MNTVRVIAGKWKGRPLAAPSGTVARPTTDRVKESMFSIMGITWSGGVAVDLFAGSGALGIEALSRGADEAAFIDTHHESLRAVRDNLSRCGALSQAHIWKADWRQGWDRVASHWDRVGWVFVDPPYAKNLWEPVLQVLAKSTVPIDDGVVCEHPREIVLPEQVGVLSVVKRKEYGDIALTLYRRETMSP